MDFSEFYREWDFWFFLVQWLAVALTAPIPPLPAEFMVIASGALAADGVFPLRFAFLATFFGSVVGDIGLYALFRYQLIGFFYRWRWGRQLHRRIVRVSLRSGPYSTWAGLLLVYAMPFGRSAAMATAGMMRMGWVRLVTLAVTGGFLWSWWLIGLGYLPAALTSIPSWLSTVVGIGIGTLAGVMVAYLVSRSSRTKT